MRTEQIRELIDSNEEWSDHHLRWTSRDFLDRIKLDIPNLTWQIQVRKDRGEIITDGKHKYYMDGDTKYYNIRIDSPERNDKSDSFLFADYAQCIGTNGYDYVNNRSLFICIDIDSTKNHANGLGDDAIVDLIATVSDLDYVEVRHSKGGKGIHLFIWLDRMSTATPQEHRALASAIVDKISLDLRGNIKDQVDCAGSIVWICAIDAHPDGFKLLSESTRTLCESDLPGWRDYIPVATHQQNKVSLKGADPDMWDRLTSAFPHVAFGDGHKRILDAYTETGYPLSYIADRNCYSVHTYGLQMVHEKLGLRGVFTTVSQGTDPSKPNAYMFPKEGEEFQLFRFNNATESSTWTESSGGLNTCIFNRHCDLDTAIIATDGRYIGDNKGHAFEKAADAIRALEMMGKTVDIDTSWGDRPAIIQPDKGTGIKLLIERSDDDPGKIKGWNPIKKTHWQRVIDVDLDSQGHDMARVEDRVRFCNDDMGNEVGWVHRSNNKWIKTTRQTIVDVLRNVVDSKMINKSISYCVHHPWTTCYRPFKSEYPGNRLWNKDAPQFKFTPSGVTNPTTPTFDMVFKHLFGSLDDDVRKNPWCQANNILTGAHYGFAWTASIFRESFKPLPMLFFCGDPTGGKTTFHGMFRLLATSGVKRGTTAITNQGGFTGGINGAVLCYIEEHNLSKLDIYNLFKEIITTKNAFIHKKGHDEYERPSTWHWCMMANDRYYLPIPPGDTRITVVDVPPVEEDIPEEVLFASLEQEAPDFVQKIINYKLPNVISRLAVEVIDTDVKRDIQEKYKHPIEQFIDECCAVKAGKKAQLSDFIGAYNTWASKRDDRALATQPDDIKAYFKSKGRYKKIGGNYCILGLTLKPKK